MTIIYKITIKINKIIIIIHKITIRKQKHDNNT